MSNSDYPVGAADDPEAPFNQEDCNECEGCGEICENCFSAERYCACPPKEQCISVCTSCS